MASPKKTDKSFNDLMQELEAIVDWFEKEDIDLDEGLKKFERGAVIADELKKQLSGVENKIKKIQANFE